MTHDFATSYDIHIVLYDSRFRDKS